MSAPAWSWPPRRALALAGALVAPLLAVAAVANALDGPVAALGVVLGFLAGLVPAVARTGAGVVVGAAAATAAAGAVGLAVSGSAVGTALAVAASALLAAPLNRRVAGAGALLPVLVALSASVGLEDRPLALASWLLVGFGIVAVLARLLPARASLPGAPAGMAWRHAAATALAAGAAAFVVVELEVSHGYWMVLAIASILRPVPGETGHLAVERVLGTLVGIVAGVVGVLVLPTPLALVTALVLLLLTVGWAVVKEQRLLAAASTALVVLLSSGGLAGESVVVAVDRLLLTVAGAAVALLAAWLLHRTERAPGRTDVPAGST
ncbi:MAG: FUSC family protein [Actinotalea sp.]|nr:FUSC family protein [Actinotalea sp.]